MTVRHAIWTVGDKPAPLPSGTLSSELLLEQMIVAAPQMLSDGRSADPAEIQRTDARQGISGYQSIRMEASRTTVCHMAICSRM